MRAKVRILVVESELPLASFMAHVLARAGCSVQVATTGKRGLAMANARKFDLVTVDLRLPDINGFEVCSRLKQGHLSLNTPIIIISEKPSESNIREAMKRGAVDCLTKPFDAADFIYRVILHAKAEIDAAANLKMQESPV